MRLVTSKLIITLFLFGAAAMPFRLAAQVGQQARYKLINLGTLGGTMGAAFGITNTGWVTGDANLPGDQNEHGFLWRKGVMTDLGTFGGPNGSAPGFQNDEGVIVGSAQTPEKDPFGEQFLAYFCTTAPCQGFDYISLPFRWQDGIMTALPTLGGNNGQAVTVNNRGQMVGFAENSTQDPSCILPQRLDFEAVIWEAKEGEIHELPPFSPDAVGLAAAINGEGQVVGCSGTCGSTSFPAAVFITDCVHPTLWQKNGSDSGFSVTNLGGFGGVMNNLATAINNRGQVAGLSDLAGDTTAHAFLWQDGVMTDLGTLSGDVFSFASGMNNMGQVVGQSCDQMGNCRAFLWENGVMTDLNTLIPSGSSLFLISGGDINDRGEIAGQAYDPNTGDLPAFLAIPEMEPSAVPLGANLASHVSLPDNVRKLLQRRMKIGPFGRGR